jgi:hypothetical protein
MQERLNELKEYVQYRAGKTPDNIRWLIKYFEELKELARDINENYDCDFDAHRYNTSCRACEAGKILESLSK